MKRDLRDRHRWIEYLVHTTCAVSVIVAAYVYVWPQIKDDHEGIKKGQDIALNVQIGGLDNEETLVLALSPTCPYCLKSLPFYKEVGDRIPDVRMVGIVDTSVSVRRMSSIMEKAGVRLDTMLAVPFDDIGVWGVPIVFTVSVNGQVGNVWVGLLDANKEDALMSAIGDKSD